MSENKKLPQYKGVLTSMQVADGMNAATRNAKRLTQDAKTMLDLERFPTAVALAILAIEESGKHAVLREMALARNRDELSTTWREYRQHTRAGGPGNDSPASQRNRILPLGAPFKPSFGLSGDVSVR